MINRPVLYFRTLAGFINEIDSVSQQSQGVVSDSRETCRHRKSLEAGRTLLFLCPFGISIPTLEILFSLCVSVLREANTIGRNFDDPHCINQRGA